jgi:hypothetical protein
VMLVFRQGMRLSLARISVGLVAAAGLTLLMAKHALRRETQDAATFRVVTAGMTAVALATCVTPALRAASVDPAVALGSD